jgi:hypothetical protein
MLMLIVVASPAAALLTDQEPSNDSMSTAAIQITPSGTTITDGGKFSFTAGGGDIDFVGIGGLLAGDVVTVLTTPLNDPPDFESPDTIVGLFDSNENMLCVYDDAFNNELNEFPVGYGSLCRLEIPADGDYFVGVTGLSADPFNAAHFETGPYSLTLTIVPLPEPGVMLQLASGLLGLAMLDKRRRSSNR